jgi:thymidine phosphorylase
VTHVEVIRPSELIQRKRDGEELSAAEIADLILGYARGEVVSPRRRRSR